MPSIKKSVEWAIERCNNQKVGYSQDYRCNQTVNGVTYYDCSSFIWYALKAGDFDVVSANDYINYPFTTYTMAPVLRKLGFKNIPLTDKWEQGDICLGTEHTEMVYKGYVGCGVCMGAHGRNGVLLENQVSIGDKYGNKDGLSYKSRWFSLWRYIKKDQEQKEEKITVKEKRKKESYFIMVR